MALALRAARTRDLSAVYDLLERAFPAAPRSLFVAQTEHDSTFRLRHARVAIVDGDLAAYTRIFARRMLIRGVPVPAGGIGSVATHPEFRGRGLASLLVRDALDVMRREGMLVSFLFTGIPSFYARLGYTLVLEPGFEADPREAAALAPSSLYSARAMTDGDVPRLLALYRRATAGHSGAIARTRRTWRDAGHWLGEQPGDGIVAERNGAVVAYLRSRCRTYGHQVLEAEHASGHADALATLVAAAGVRAAGHGERLTALAPADHQLATVLRSLPSTTGTVDVAFPMMMRVVALQPLVEALLPYVATRAAGHPGPELRVRLAAPDQQALMLEVKSRSATVSPDGAGFALDTGATLAVLLGQHAAGPLLLPPGPAGVRRRFEQVFPQAALHFWNSDRV